MRKPASGGGAGVSVKEHGRTGLLLLLTLLLTGCMETNMEARTQTGHLTTDHFVRDVANHPAFRGFGELMLPWEDNTRYFDTRLGQVGALMPYHGHVNADVAVGALNRLMDDANAGKIRGPG